MTGCEVIREEERLLPATSVQAESNALLIEFTGFLCVNCPLAAEEAHQLQKAFGDHLTIVAMHPADNHFTQTKNAEYDYTCPEANTYYRYFGGTSTTPFPTGTVDMQNGWLDYPSWATAVLASVTHKKSGHVSLTSTPTADSDSLCDIQAAVSVEPDKHYPQGTSRPVQLLLWLVTDSLTGAQMMPDGSTNLAYTHRHLLRGSVFEDPWGVTLTCEAGGEPTSLETAAPIIADRLVAVLLDAETKELLDVEEYKMKTN